MRRLFIHTFVILFISSTCFISSSFAQCLYNETHCQCLPSVEDHICLRYQSGRGRNSICIADHCDDRHYKCDCRGDHICPISKCKPRWKPVGSGLIEIGDVYNCEKVTSYHQPSSSPSESAYQSDESMTQNSTTNTTLETNSENDNYLMSHDECVGDPKGVRLPSASPTPKVLMCNVEAGVCCAQNCSVCAVEGCEKRHSAFPKKDMAKYCCQEEIRESGRRCGEHYVPCILPQESMNETQTNSTTYSMESRQHTPSASTTPLISESPSASASPSSSVSLSPSHSPTPTTSVSSSPSKSESPSASQSLTPYPSMSSSPSHSPTPTSSRTPSSTPSHTPSKTPSHSPSPTSSKTPSKSPSPTSSKTPSKSPSPTPTPSKSSTPSSTATPTASKSASPSPEILNTQEVMVSETPSTTPKYHSTDHDTDDGSSYPVEVTVPIREPTLSPSKSPIISMAKPVKLCHIVAGICCDNLCKHCGEKNCALNEDGSFNSTLATHCCAENIHPQNRNCAIDTPPCTLPGFKPTPSPSASPTVTSARGRLCNETEKVCCHESCQVCGGMTCADDSQGIFNLTIADNCCGNFIKVSGTICANDLSNVPCVIHKYQTQTPSAYPSPTPSPSNDLKKLMATSFGKMCNRDAGVCCDETCAVCAETNCGNDELGNFQTVIADNCCRRNIVPSGRICGQNDPPCVMPTESPAAMGEN